MRYYDSKSVKIGDTFVAPRWGTCKVIKYDKANGSFIAKNIQTNEVFDFLGQATFSESDLISRK